MIKLNSIIGIKQNDILESKIDDELVMMSINNGAYYAMSKVGCAIWNFLKLNESTVVLDLCDYLLTRFEVSRETCEAETITFLEGLLDNQLIQVKKQ